MKGALSEYALAADRSLGSRHCRGSRGAFPPCFLPSIAAATASSPPARPRAGASVQGAAAAATTETPPPARCQLLPPAERPERRRRILRTVGVAAGVAAAPAGGFRIGP